MLRSLAMGAVTAASLGAIAVAQPEPPNPPAPPAKQKPACFFTRDVNGFAAPNDRTLYLRVRVRDVYRLDMKWPCADMDWEHKVGIDTRGSAAICGPLDVMVQVQSPIGVNRCAVEAVTRLTEAEVAALPKGSRP